MLCKASNEPKLAVTRFFGTKQKIQMKKEVENSKKNIQKSKGKGKKTGYQIKKKKLNINQDL